MTSAKALRIAGRILMLIVMIAAGWLFYRELRHYSLSEIRDRMLMIPPWRIWLCVGLTALNYAILMGYDLVAVRALGSDLPTRKVLLAAFTGHVTAMNLGPVLGGTPVRMRLYTSWGMTAMQVAQVLAMVVLTFWLGMLALAGVVFLAVPVPPLSILHVGSLHRLGAGALVLAGAYLVLTVVRRKPLPVFKWHLPVPPARTALLQMTITAADLTVAAGALYVLMPGDWGGTFAQFLGVYLLAIIAVTFAQVPGGIGVLDLAIMTLSPGQLPEAKAAALLIFRLIYYIIPLAIAAGLLLYCELRSHHSSQQG